MDHHLLALAKYKHTLRGGYSASPPMFVELLTALETISHHLVWSGLVGHSVVMFMQMCVLDGSFLVECRRG